MKHKRKHSPQRGAKVILAGSVDGEDKYPELGVDMSYPLAVDMTREQGEAVGAWWDEGRKSSSRPNSSSGRTEAWLRQHTVLDRSVAWSRRCGQIDHAVRIAGVSGPPWHAKESALHTRSPTCGPPNCIDAEQACQEIA